VVHGELIGALGGSVALKFLLGEASLVGEASLASASAH